MSEKPSPIPACLNKYAPSGGPERGYLDPREIVAMNEPVPR